MHLDALRRFILSVQIAEIHSGLKVSASVPKMSSYTCNIASTDTKSWKLPEKNNLILLISHHYLCMLTAEEEII